MRVMYWVVKAGKWIQVSRDDFDAWNGDRLVTAKGLSPAWYAVRNHLAAMSGRPFM